MQISNGSNARLSPAPERTTPVAADASTVRQAAAAEPALPAEAPSQDAAVTISPEGAATAAQASQAAPEAGSAPGDGGGERKPAEVSAVRSFAYGALGLERPDESQTNRNEFYTAGKWLAAGLTIGGLISLLV
jgi:hypothetical protein